MLSWIRERFARLKLQMKRRSLIRQRDRVVLRFRDCNIPYWTDAEVVDLQRQINAITRQMDGGDE